LVVEYEVVLTRKEHLTASGLSVQEVNEILDAVAKVGVRVPLRSGSRTRELVKDAELLASIKLDPSRQLIGAQCSGTLVPRSWGCSGIGRLAPM
jgi:hypothetical protein